MSSIAVAAITVFIPFTPQAEALGLVPPTAAMLLALGAITAGYVAVTELAKRLFHRAVTVNPPINLSRLL